MIDVAHAITQVIIEVISSLLPPGRPAPEILPDSDVADLPASGVGET